MLYPELPLSLTLPEEKALTGAIVRFFTSPQAFPVETLEPWVKTPSVHPERAAALFMQAANAVLDEEGSQLFAIFEQQKRPVVCYSGCFSCCCQLVRCTPFDALLIRHFLEKDQDALTRFEAAYTQWDTSTASMRPDYLRWAERYAREGVDDGSHRFQEYFVRCPFLDAEDRCFIYPVRPYCCRSCIAVDSACHTPAIQGDAPGMRNMLYGNHTQHKATREALTDMLWNSFGLNPECAAFIPMVELVHHLLQKSFSETLVWAMRP